MTSIALPERIDIRQIAVPSVPVLIGTVAFGVLFWEPMATLVRDWWNDPEAGHGLLLGPLAIWLAWKSGIRKEAVGQPMLGLALLLGAVMLRYVSGLAAELFTMRMSLMGAIGAVIVMGYGLRQLTRWWLPATLLLLSVPIPAVILGTLALPL